MARAKAVVTDEASEAVAVVFTYTSEGTSGVTQCVAALGDLTLAKRFTPDSPDLRAQVESNLAARLTGETTDAPTFGVAES
jgi:hypothetical protein